MHEETRGHRDHPSSAACTHQTSALAESAARSLSAVALAAAFYGLLVLMALAYQLTLAGTQL